MQDNSENCSLNQFVITFMTYNILTSLGLREGNVVNTKSKARITLYIFNFVLLIRTRSNLQAEFERFTLQTK